MAWNEQLEVAAFRGLEFDCLSVEDPFERRVVAHEYPFRDGAELVDLGRKARISNFEAVFYGLDYESKLGSFLLIAQEGKTGPLRHPILGTYQAKVLSVNITHSTDSRDFAAVQISFQEDGLDAEIPTIFSVDAAINELEAEISEYEDTINDIYTIPPPDVFDLIAEVENFVLDIQEFVADLNERIHQINTVVVRAIATARQLGDVDSWPIVRSARRVFFAAKKAKASMERLLPRVETRRLNVHTPLAALAARQYGDGTRADELLRLNRVRNPFIVKPGTILKIHDNNEK